MYVRSLHSNIKNELIKVLESATRTLHVAVAWFIDEDIFNLICKKAVQNVGVQVIIHDDLKEPNSINFSKSGLDFSRLHFCGGQIFLLKGHHNKYCIIDNKIYLSGSYNWTHGASIKQDGFESLEITENTELATTKERAFLELKAMSQSYISVLGKFTIPKIDPRKLLLMETIPVNNHFVEAKVANESGKIFLRLYIPGNIDDLPGIRSFFVLDKRDCLFIGPHTRFSIYYNTLWLLPKVS